VDVFINSKELHLRTQTRSHARILAVLNGVTLQSKPGRGLTVGRNGTRYEFQAVSRLLAIILLTVSAIHSTTCLPCTPPLISQVLFPCRSLFSLTVLHLAQDISAAEQVSLHDSTVPPELSPTGSDPTSSASSPSSSVPVTPLDAPPFAVPPDPLVYGKHQPAPRPFRPTTKSASRGTVWRARQALLSLGKWKRQASSDTGISTGVQLSTDYDEPEVSNPSSPSEVEPPPSQVS
jgi:hypothetical protein